MSLSYHAVMVTFNSITEEDLCSMIVAQKTLGDFRIVPHSIILTPRRLRWIGELWASLQFIVKPCAKIKMFDK